MNLIELNRSLVQLRLSGIASRHAEADDQNACALQEVAAIQCGPGVRSHGCGSHFATSFA